MSKKSLRVLLVEDHPDFGKVLAMVLEMLGHQVNLVAEPGSALVRAKDAEFDVLITDIHLPGMNGWELILELRRRGDLPRLTVSMSDWNSGTEWAQSKRAGCDEYLCKPFKMEELEALLDRIS